MPPAVKDNAEWRRCDWHIYCGDWGDWGDWDIEADVTFPKRVYGDGGSEREDIFKGGHLCIITHHVDFVYMEHHVRWR